MVYMYNLKGTLNQGSHQHQIYIYIPIVCNGNLTQANA